MIPLQQTPVKKAHFQFPKISIQLVCSCNCPHNLVEQSEWYLQQGLISARALQSAALVPFFDTGAERMLKRGHHLQHSVRL